MVSLGILVGTAVLCTLFPANGYGQPSPQTEAESQPPKTVIELQQFRKTTSIPIQNKPGQQASATLINLNPQINAWFLLRLQWDRTGAAEIYHLENRLPESQRLILDPGYPNGIVIETDDNRYACELWADASSSTLAQARASPKTYAPLCDERIYVRNRTEGYKTSLEWATDFLRNYVPGGERITVFVRETFYQDAFRNTSEVIPAEEPGKGAARPRPPSAPARPLVDSRYDNHYLVPTDLGIELDYEVENKVLVGRWYSATGLPGIFVSAIQPALVAQEVIQSQKNLLNPLDETESSALVYMVAFDLDQFEVDFAMGTEHPRVDWSDRVLPAVRDNSLPGPDGINTVEPLVNTGMVSPAYAGRIAATFIGGFKRFHGAFKHGAFALKNRGTHYGFMESGVVMSTLQPGLATAIVYANGTVELKTWTDHDNADLARIRHARQNGPPIIEYDEATGVSKPGALVRQWGLGNWSGSVEGRYRTLRAGLGLQEHEGRRFLMYGYFSTATPSAMARVFQAYRCKYAMLLDINALEHTYLAVYRRQHRRFQVQNLIQGMSALDKSSGNQVVPRFVGYADNRDFFYLLRKEK